jgi:transcriptional regulator with XRE-family HTH domain
MSSKSTKHIAARVKELRTEARMTQKELSEKCNLSTNYISRIERADVVVSINSLEKLTMALRVSSSDILPF